MNVKREIITLAIRFLSEKTNIVPKPDPWTELTSVLFGGGTYEQQLAASVEENLDKATVASKRAITNFKFKKITKHF